MLKWRDGHSKFYGGGDRPTYSGTVLKVGDTRSVRVMSDVWGTETFATVWDGEKITTEPYALSDDMGYRIYADADVDATFEARAAARAFTVAREAERAKNDWIAATDRMAAEAARPSRGKFVIVARGRKVPKGTTGELFWTGYGKFGIRAGLKDAAGTTYWTALSNLDVINPDDYIDEIPVRPTDAELLAAADARIPKLEAA
jgi:hypothetical protein